jgi:hypothetical protein
LWTERLHLLFVFRWVVRGSFEKPAVQLRLEEYQNHNYSDNVQQQQQHDNEGRTLGTLRVAISAEACDAHYIPNHMEMASARATRSSPWPTPFASATLVYWCTITLASASIWSPSTNDTIHTYTLADLHALTHHRLPTLWQVEEVFKVALKQRPAATANNTGARMDNRKSKRLGKVIQKFSNFFFATP